MDRDAFVAHVGSAFERAPWVAEAAWVRQPFGSPAELHAAMFDVVEQAPLITRIAFLCGHPDLAGKEAQEGTMTSESVGEQAEAGLDALTAEELAEFEALNRAYRARHGFPFIIAARLHDKQQILRAMRGRLGGDTSGEIDEALTQIGIITRFRIEALLGKQ